MTNGRIKNFVVENTQVSLFLKNFVLRGSDVLIFASDMVRELKFFDGISQPLPIPDDAPADIPRMILKSKDNRYECQISLNKMGFVNRNVDKYSEDEMIEDVIKRAKLIANYLVEKKKILINRIGNIIAGNVEVDGATSAEYLVNEFGSTKKFDKPYEFNIRYITQKDQIAGLKTNTVLMLGQKGSGNSLNKDNQNIVTINVDVNTAPDLMEKEEFTNSQIDKYIDEGFNRAAQIVNEYGFDKK